MLNVCPILHRMVSSSFRLDEPRSTNHSIEPFVNSSPLTAFGVMTDLQPDTPYPAVLRNWKRKKPFSTMITNSATVEYARED